MYKFNFSIRAYLVATRRGYDITTAIGCINAANDLLAHHCHGVGKRTITEFYRAGGLGVYQIAALVGKTPADVRNICERFDKTLHGLR